MLWIINELSYTTTLPHTELNDSLSLLEHVIDFPL